MHKPNSYKWQMSHVRPFARSRRGSGAWAVIAKAAIAAPIVVTAANDCRSNDGRGSPRRASCLLAEAASDGPACSIARQAAREPLTIRPRPSRQHGSSTRGRPSAPGGMATFRCKWYAEHAFSDARSRAASITQGAVTSWPPAHAPLIQWKNNARSADRVALSSTVRTVRVKI